MKTLIISLILLFTIPAFALDPEPVSIFESNGVLYVIDVSPEDYVPPEPVDVEVEFVREKQPSRFNPIKIIDWGSILFLP